MIDFSNIEQYRENNRIEAKKALGGLPQSIWETYSAFANTLGGVILLGVEEYRDHSLHPVDLPDPERLIDEFWDIINDPKKISVNILTEDQVQIIETDGKSIIAIIVPRAQRYDRPVYMDTNPFSGSYRRNGEGDYRCTREEVQSMLRDARVQTPDMAVLDQVGLGALDNDSICRYRARMEDCRPGHVWEDLAVTDFLDHLGAIGKSAAGTMHPTAAGLLMFGREQEIVKVFPHYALDYQEQLGPDDSLTDRIRSSSGDWSGNLYDFCLRVSHRLTQHITISGKTENKAYPEEVSVYDALREALANCLTNADYYGSQGLLIVRRRDRITFTNPGAFRIEVEAAKSGGISDPRNMALTRMFNLVGIGNGTGSGIPGIYSAWRHQGWAQPVIAEAFAPERTTLLLPLGKKCGRDPASSSKEQRASLDPVKKQWIINYLTDHVSASAGTIAAYMQLTPSNTLAYLQELMKEDIITAAGSALDPVYQLKS